MFFGLFSGLLFGAVTGLACHLIVGSPQPLSQFGFVGGLAGVVYGCAIGVRDRRKHGGALESNAATHIGILFGLIPGLLLLLGGIGIVRGKFSVYVVVSGFFMCPMAGLLVGGLLDRMYEAYLKSRYEGPTEQE
jgi:hypothetical protein